MTNLEKIKALQFKAGHEADGMATTKTWVGIYSLIFASLPNQYSIVALIKAIQQKLAIKCTGKAGTKTWDAIYQFLIGDQIPTIAPQIDTYNETALRGMTKEVIPFAKELINLAASQGIHIRLMNNAQQQIIEKENNTRHVYTDGQTNFSNYNFGLVFDIGIFEENNSGEFIQNNNVRLYDKVAKLGESIGLTWAGSRKSTTGMPHFELRPAWALRMGEDEMVKELHRRKNENLNLLAIL